MISPLGRLVLYTRKPGEMEAFYCTYFGYEALHDDADRIIELHPTGSVGAALLLHPAGKGQRQGQSLVKLVFDVEDVEAFCARARSGGLAFGPLHHADGYVFANAKDPSGNSVSVSSRAFAQKAP